MISDIFIFHNFKNLKNIQLNQLFQNQNKNNEKLKITKHIYNPISPNKNKSFGFKALIYIII